MSATLEEDLISTYFRCPIIFVEGRTFPVEEHFLDDSFKFITSSRPSDQPQLADASRKQRRAATGGVQKLITELKTVRPGLLHKHAMFYDLIAELLSSIMKRYGAVSAAGEDRGNCVLIFLSGKMLSLGSFLLNNAFCRHQRDQAIEQRDPQTRIRRARHGTLPTWIIAATAAETRLPNHSQGRMENCPRHEHR
jgi:hypothetical protein